MITRIPPWALAAGGLLAFGAGIINVVGLLSFDHQVVTHLTGTTSMLGEAIARGDVGHMLRYAGLILAFVAGCVISGVIVEDSALKVGRRYSATLFGQAAGLVVAAFLLQRQHASGLYLLAFCCGLQNAMVTTFSGSVIRTTHVSGMFTDLGIFLGHRARGIPADGRRLRLSLTVICAFLAGGALGAWCFTWWSNFALLIPAIGSASLAAVHEIVLIRRRARERLSARGAPAGRRNGP